MTDSTTSEFARNGRDSPKRGAKRWIAACCVLIAATSQAGAAGPRAPLDDIAVIDLAGAQSSLQAQVAGPTVLNVWATWCPPCRTEMPSLQKLESLVAADGVAVVAFSVDTDPNLVREFVLKYGITLPVSIAVNPDLAMKKLEVVGLPLTLYLDGSGKLVGRHVGQRDWAAAEVVTEVRRRLAPQSTATRR